MQTCPLLQLSPDDGMERSGANDGRHADGLWSRAVRSYSAIGKRCRELEPQTLDVSSTKRVSKDRDTNEQIGNGYQVVTWDE
jgi:hypothetical protein